MTRTTGFDHVATVTADLDRIIGHYGIAVASRTSLDDMRQRLANAGPGRGLLRLSRECYHGKLLSSASAWSRSSATPWLSSRPNTSFPAAALLRIPSA